jgi:hypothetical protein
MSRPREEREVSVTEGAGGYVSTSEGPVADTIVHTRSTPGIVPEASAPAAPVSRDVVEREGPDIRKSMRKPEDVERHRTRRARTQRSPLLLATLFFLMILAIAATALVLIVHREQRAPPPAPPPPPAEIGGVPVRHGMKGTVD